MRLLRRPVSDWRKALRCVGRSQPAVLIAGLLLLLSATQMLGQGCTQCLDSTRATPPAVQAAYRHAILLLGGFGALLFVTGALLLHREP